jgi:hypothetical protein
MARGCDAETKAALPFPASADGAGLCDGQPRFGRSLSGALSGLLREFALVFGTQAEFLENHLDRALRSSASSRSTGTDRRVSDTCLEPRWNLPAVDQARGRPVIDD